jgi:hypothetical protein
VTRINTSNARPGTAIYVLIIVSILLYREFYEPGLTAWNAALGLFLLGLIVAAAFLSRFFTMHAGEIGEARFDTRDKSDIDG